MSPARDRGLPDQTDCVVRSSRRDLRGPGVGHLIIDTAERDARSQSARVGLARSCSLKTTSSISVSPSAFSTVAAIR